MIDVSPYHRLSWVRVRIISFYCNYVRITNRGTTRGVYPSCFSSTLRTFLSSMLFLVDFLSAMKGNYLSTFTFPHFDSSIKIKSCTLASTFGNDFPRSIIILLSNASFHNPLWNAAIFSVLVLQLQLLLWGKNHTVASIIHLITVPWQIFPCAVLHPPWSNKRSMHFSFNWSKFVIELAFSEWKLAFSEWKPVCRIPS